MRIQQARNAAGTVISCRLPNNKNKVLRQEQNGKQLSHRTHEEGKQGKQEDGIHFRWQQMIFRTNEEIKEKTITDLIEDTLVKFVNASQNDQIRTF